MIIYQFTLKKFLSPRLVLLISLADIVEDKPEPGFGIVNNLLNFHMEAMIRTMLQTEGVEMVDGCNRHCR
jgi:hypothetical protein